MDALGIDIGSTNVKVVLVRDDGATLGAAQRPLVWERHGDVAEQDAVAHFHIQSNQCALVILLARTHSQDFALVWFFSSAVWNDNAGSCFGFVFNAFHNHAVVQWTKFHGFSLIKTMG